ncbi:hypothetical protein Fcan01_10311 [Folsomia candida]|uniref:Uncharacterized protein n=1 Tax=Folsomia candida TaxID=158441 RepID=A0A226EBM6_FOLCA|nr:hypothetical protein Fcan01_10311 [Folsomia candida]
MLSNRSFKVFALITKICQYFGAAPFSANLNTRRIYITKEASNAQRSRFRNHLVFLAHVLIQTVFLRFYTEDVTMINFCLTALLPLTVVTLIWLPSALFGNDFVYFFNSLLLVTEQYQGNWYSHIPPASNSLNRYITASLYIVGNTQVSMTYSFITFANLNLAIFDLIPGTFCGIPGSEIFSKPPHFYGA